MKGAFFSCGQNCAGAERFFVQEGVYDTFVQQVADTTARMRQGPAVGGGTVDCGAMCMPGLAQKVAELVNDAVQRGAKASTITRLSAVTAWLDWDSLCERLARLL